MKLGELFKKLSYIELSNLSLSGEGSGAINEASQSRLITATNDALKDVFTRLVLHERQLIVKTLDWKNLYYLRKEHAMLDPTPGYLKYIIDTPANKFTGDLVKILAVYNEIGEELPMNDQEQWASVFTPQYDCVQFNHPGYDQIFNVAYQALHPELLDMGDNLLDQVLLVPPTLEDLLRTKVAYCVFSAMSGQDYSIKAQALEAKYESLYNLIDQKNLLGGVSMATNVKLHRRGFV
jgi:hypothetical protein